MLVLHKDIDDGYGSTGRVGVVASAGFRVPSILVKFPK